MADLGSVLSTPPVATWTTLQLLWAVSLQPTPVLSPGLSTQAWVSAPRPCTHQQMHISGWGVQWGVQDHLSWSVSVLPAISQLLHSPVSLWSSLFVPNDPPAGEGSSQGEGSLLSQLPPRGAGPILIPFFFFFHPIWLNSYLSCSFSCMSSSASIQ